MKVTEGLERLELVKQAVDGKCYKAPAFTTYSAPGMPKPIVLDYVEGTPKTLTIVAEDIVINPIIFHELAHMAAREDKAMAKAKITYADLDEALKDLGI